MYRLHLLSGLKNSLEEAAKLKHLLIKITTLIVEMEL